MLERSADLREAHAGWSRVGLVPTMGYLHEGHLSLIRAARRESDTVVMSLFVNPAQFGPREDLASYPRDIERDLQLARDAGCDIVFLPQAEEVYPPGFDTWVEPGALARRWEGERRSGHFRGVATVVLKLFTMVQPERAYFGEKDYQQLLIVTKMVDDLNLPLTIVPCPTIREESGLALSSRNAYLSADERRSAAVLYRALRTGADLARRGERSVAALEASMRGVVSKDPAARLDYLAIVAPKDLEPLVRLEQPGRVLAAMSYGPVRLIDNLAIESSDE